MTMSKKMITLKSSDDVTFVVDEAVVLQSQILSHLIEDCPAREHKINEVTGKILAKVVEYCENHVVDGGDDLKKWDDEFIKQLDLSTIYDLINAANYLDVRGLLDLLYQRVADVIGECKDGEEIRATFGIENDFTAEEEAEIVKVSECALD